jgi:hypothetical protein
MINADSGAKEGTASARKEYGMGDKASRSSPDRQDRHHGEKSENPSIEKELEKFTKAADSLVATAPLALWAVEAAHRGAHQELKAFVETNCTNVRKEGENTVGDVPPALIHESRVIQRRFDRASIASKVVAHSSVVSLVSQYDSFLGGLLRACFRLRPELLNASDRTLTLKELQGFESIDAAREFIVEQEVETVIRKSHVEQFEWMENRFSVKLRAGLDVWPTFVEVTERRNLLVHSGGIISPHYLSVCRQHGANCEALGAVGTELTISRAYLISAYESLVEIGVKLAHVLWRKLARTPEEIADADNRLNLLCLDLMTEGRNGLARRLLDFSTCVLKKWSTEANRLLFVVNRAQACKWQNDEAACQKILKEEDWSAVGDKLSLGVAVLKGNLAEAVSLMRKTANLPDMPREAYRAWPIFKEFRRTPEFTIAYREIFREDFADVPEQNTITFKLEFGQPTGGPAQGERQEPKPN